MHESTGSPEAKVLRSQKLATLTFILLSGLGYSPAVAANVRLLRTPTLITAATSQLRVTCHLDTGLLDLEWPGGAAIHGASCGARLSSGLELDSTTCASHRCEAGDLVRIRDGFGPGYRITIHHVSPGRPELRQHVRVYEKVPYALLQVEVVSKVPVPSNHITPLIIGSGKTPGAGVHLDAGGVPRALFVPFDNDDFVRYNSNQASESCEVTALYDNASRHGFVLGSVSHDVWKTGFNMAGFGDRAISRLSAIAGATGRWTHDSEPHGLVSGTTIASPPILVGYFPDWRDGLEAFGDANARITPPLPWREGVPFGWNSWAAYGTRINFERYVATSDFFRDHLQSAGFSNNHLDYINLDSFWDNMSESQLKEAVRHIHAAGQKAGIYWTPFTWWGSDPKQIVEETGGKYTYSDLLIRDSHGEPVHKGKAGQAIDPSHPGALARIDYQMRKFVEWGFDFVKLDFISHGALEGTHFDPHVTTGIAAYNVGMKRIVEDLDPRRIGRPFFISLSIAPLFPAGYGHSRRISCDTFGKISNSEYMLNSLTYGWWENGTLYRFNDPDHTVLSDSEVAARTRLNASVITGTVLLDSDDLTNPALQQRAVRLLTNREINDVARSGRAFRPVEGDTGARAADLFIRRDSGVRCFVAVFNFGAAPVSRSIHLDRLGLNPKARYRVRDLWSKQQRVVQDNFAVDLEAGESTVLRLDRE